MRVANARRRAALSQRELARRTGVHQPNIAAIEAGRTIPSERTLERLLQATRERPSVVLDRQRKAVREIITSYGGHNPRVFGSAARGADQVTSDLDLLIRFEPGTSIFDVVGLARELEELLGVRVDIASDGATGPVLARARDQAVPV